MGMTNLKTSEFWIMSLSAIDLAQEKLAILANRGLTQHDIDNLRTAAAKLQQAIQAKIQAVRVRDEATQERAEKGNYLFDLISDISIVGKGHYANINEAKYNDYVLYDGPNVHDTAPDTPPTE
jgi:hypothetical protein